MSGTPPMPWDEAAVRRLVADLEVHRRGCRVTTLTEVSEVRQSPFALLVACIISLRTKDEVTHAASSRHLALAGDAASLAALTTATIAEAIYPAGFYNTKARQLKRIGELLGERHGGRVPATLSELLALPGVGRKTASLVLGLGFGLPAICVDTHVHRLSNRLGLVATATPEATEQALATALPVDLWIAINDLLVTFGQTCCHPTSPHCSRCPLADRCARVGVTRRR